MTTDLISLAVIAAIATAAPALASIIPNKLIPETVFLLIAGAICGPYMAGFIAVSDSVEFMSELGLGFLFLLAGYEINPKDLTGRQGKRGLATWVITLALAFLAVRISPNFSVSHVDGIAIAIALTTTALGTLIPILKERGLTGTRVGSSILSYGTWGELMPVFAMALLLSTRAEWKTLLILAAFLIVAIAVAAITSRARKKGNEAFAFLNKNADTTSQMVMRTTVLLLIGLLTLSAVFNLDIVLGAFAAGFVLRYIIPEGHAGLEKKLDGLAYGFFIPIFFVISGAKIDLAAVFMQPFLLIGFIVMLIIIRAIPIYIALSTDRKMRDMSPNNKITVALYCTTALPLIVAVTSIAVSVGAMEQMTASVLVAAGAITVFLMPLLASITYRVADAQPFEAVREIKKHPRDARSIIRDHIALERMLAKQYALDKTSSFIRGRVVQHAGKPGKAIADESWATSPEVERAAALLNAETLDETEWHEAKVRGEEEWTELKGTGDTRWEQLKELGNSRWDAIKALGDDMIAAQASSSWQDKAAVLQERAELREAAEAARDGLAQKAASFRAARADRVADMFTQAHMRRLADLKQTEHNNTEHDRTKHHDFMNYKTKSRSDAASKKARRHRMRKDKDDNAS